MKVEQVRDKYEKRILALLESVRELGTGCSKVDFDNSDEFSWSFIFGKTGIKEGDEPGVWVKFLIAESEEREGIKGKINFQIDAVGNGGLIVSGFCPYNYTPQCWVSLKDPAAIEERFKIFETEFDASNFAHEIREWIKENPNAE